MSAPDPHAVEALEREIAPLLAGKGPQVQGAVLACLLATWLNGHDESVHDELLALHIRTVCQLLAVHRLRQATKEPRENRGYRAIRLAPSQ